MPGIRVPDIEGYVACSRCQQPWVTNEVAARTGGLCSGCFVEVRGKTTVTVASQGRTFEVKRSGLRKHPPKPMTPRRRERIKLRDRARLAALRQLAERHPIEFAEILAVERGKLGLDPWTLDAALKAQLAEAGYEVPR